MQVLDIYILAWILFLKIVWGTEKFLNLSGPWLPQL